MSWCLDFLPAQHDGQRDAVQAIAKLLEGKPADFSKALTRRGLTTGPAENAFVEMLHLLALDRVEEAFAKGQEALAAGLPPERLVVGPRVLLKKLHRHPSYQDWLVQARPSTLVHGPMVGRVSDHSVSFWVRTSRSVNITFVVHGKRTTVLTRAEDDFTAIATVSGLQPNTTYPYRILIDGKPVPLSSTQFTTYPPPGIPVPSRSVLAVVPDTFPSGNPCGTPWPVSVPRPFSC